MPQIITLLTDFGIRDAYVASLKGVILNICPGAHLIDISHLVPPQDVRAGAFLLSTVYRDFPVGAVHLAVVDPGVGTQRKGLVVRTPEYFFVGPDNGLLCGAVQKEPEWEARGLENPIFWRSTVSSTFHGRDIFAPVAAHLCSGIRWDRLGPPTVPLLAPWHSAVVERDRIAAEVIYIDHFGNVVSNLEAPTLNTFAAGQGVSVMVHGKTILGLGVTYADEPPGTILAIIGSHGYLELAVNQGSAADALRIRTGDTLFIKRRAADVFT